MPATRCESMWRHTGISVPIIKHLEQRLSWEAPLLYSPCIIREGIYENLKEPESQNLGG